MLAGGGSRRGEKAWKVREKDKSCLMEKVGRIGVQSKEETDGMPWRQERRRRWVRM